MFTAVESRKNRVLAFAVAAGCRNRVGLHFPLRQEYLALQTCRTAWLLDDTTGWVFIATAAESNPLRAITRTTNLGFCAGWDGIQYCGSWLQDSCTDDSYATYTSAKTGRWFLDNLGLHSNRNWHPTMMTPRHGDRRRGRQPAGMPPSIESRKCRGQCDTVAFCLIFCSQLPTCIGMEMCWRWTAGTIAATSSNIPMPWRLTISFTIT